MRKYIVLDTETTNSLDDALVYDLGFAVVDDNGNVYEKYSFVIAEIFLDEELMASAYFIEKVPQYWEEIKKGNRKLVRFSTARKTLKKVMERYNTNIIVAHNARFDYKSCQTTQRYLTNSRQRFFFPYGTEIWDTLKMSRELFKNNENYQMFCIENQYLTSRNQKRFTAEIIYRFLINDINFIESHTGLEDVLIEKEILSYCLNNGVINGRLWD